MLTKIKNLFATFNSFVIFHHINPDGDCLGSQAGLKELILDNYQNKSVYIIGNSNNVLSFMNFQHDLIPNDQILSQSLAIVVDANYSDRIQFKELLHAKKFKAVLRIDHHPCEDDLATKNLFVDSSFSSTCEQICFLAKEFGWKISQKAAAFLYCGLLTDSNRFFYDYTSARTHRLAALLFETKFDFYKIHLNLTKRSEKEIKFQCEVYNNYQKKANVLYYFLSLEKAKELNLDEPERNRVDFLANIDNYDIWVFFIEQEDKTIRARIRSSIYPINKVAKLFNGGGHQKAAGALLESANQIELMISKLVEFFG